jgi:1-acyl-sn-glycerol-3-phosphate acyltransferase
MGLDLKYFIKDSYTRSPLGWLFKYTGAMGVNRSHRNNLVEHCVDLLNHEPQLVVLIPAEGSRSRVDKWHTGFYHIALQSGVPVSLGYLDYKKKIAGVGKVFSLTGDFEKDMSVIQDFYQKVTPKYPEKYNPKIF